LLCDGLFVPSHGLVELRNVCILGTGLLHAFVWHAFSLIVQHVIITCAHMAVTSLQRGYR
jgi:hypothetical protein